MILHPFGQESMFWVCRWFCQKIEKFSKVLTLEVSGVELTNAFLPPDAKLFLKIITLTAGASSGEFTLWNGLTFNFETILQVTKVTLCQTCFQRKNKFVYVIFRYNL
jgi:hypothetical protein